MTIRAVLLLGLLAFAADVCAQTPAPQEPPKTPDPIEIEEEVIVTATRTGGRIDDQPTRVEVLEREEIEEKMLMTPGDIVMMLNEMGGMRVQATSPSLGAATVRIQGMRGRYTRVLFDGLPLAGQQVGGLGLLQIPPMDLAQVEVIKGVASALYGAGAMGGVINLVARRAGDDPVREVLFNQSTVGTTDGVGFFSRRLSQQLRGTLLAGTALPDEERHRRRRLVRPRGILAFRRAAASVLGRRQDPQRLAHGRALPARTVTAALSAMRRRRSCRASITARRSTRRASMSAARTSKSFAAH